MTKIRVMIADEKEIFRDGLANLLESQPSIEVVCRCENGSQAVQEAQECEPDVVLMDSRLRECNSNEATQRINKRMPNTRVAMLTDSAEEEQLVSALKAGAMGYLLKDTRIDDLVKSIELIAKGRLVVSPPLASRLASELTSVQKQRGESEPEAEISLSERETEILKLVAKGATNKEIAEKLIIADNTVKVHVRNILDKLGLRNKQQAAAYAVQQGLMGDTDVTEKPS